MMMKNKSLLLTFCLILFFQIQTIQAYDYMFGSRIDLNAEGLELRASHFTASTSDTVNFWYRGSWNPDYKIEFDFNLLFDGDFQFGIVDISTLDLGFLGFDYHLYPELNLLNFTGNLGEFQYKVGRQLIKDPGALIVGYNADAIDLSIKKNIHQFTLGVGYTGVVFNDASQFIMTNTDLSWNEILAPPRLFQYGEWSTSGLFRALDISAMVFLQEDLTPEDKLSSGEARFHSQYLELMIRGFLGSSFLYDLALVGQSGQYGDVSTLAGVGKLGIAFLPGNNRSRIGIEVTAATGDDWGRSHYYLGDIEAEKEQLNQYIPVSSVSTQGYVEKFELGNLMTLGAFYSQKSRSDKFSFELRTTSFIRVKDGPVSSTLVIDTGSSDPFLGQEGLIKLFFRPLSDFGMSTQLGVLYVGDPIEIDDNIEEYLPVLFRLGLDFSFSF